MEKPKSFIQSSDKKKKKKLPLFALLGLVWFAWFGFDLGGYDLGLCWSKKGLVMVLTKCVRHKW